MLTKIMIISVVAIVLVLLVEWYWGKRWRRPKKEFPKTWRAILKKHIGFYEKLNTEEKGLFEYKVHEFLTNVLINGVETEIDETDKVLVAASAIIPIFAFPEWKYKNLDEVLIYPGSFNLEFETRGKSRPILGMVGSGFMENKMILSKQALRQGFKNERDKRNTAIHEFVHLIDKMDGRIDGVPQALMERQYVIPWLDLIEKKVKEIAHRKSDINPYASAGREEFFAVLSEYFFERPLLLKKKHPELYELLEEIFDQDHAERRKLHLFSKEKK